MLELKAVRKMYHHRVVLDIPLLEKEPGIYWVRGENGSGKTTLLKMIAGLLPFEGDILFNRSSVKNDAVPYRRNVSWAEAEPLFPEFLTGMNLLQFYRNIRKVSENDLGLLIDLFDMKSYVQQQTGTYSAGMAKKLSLALALLGDQQLIVLDEPLITLDAGAVQTLCTYLIERSGKEKTTFLISSHQEPDSRLLLSAKELFVRNQTVL